MWHPYSAAVQLIDSDVQPVSVVSFDDLVRWSNSRDKHVICIAGPCATFRADKAAALLPLLSCPKGRRPFDHLITTESTAKAICDELGW